MYDTVKDANQYLSETVIFYGNVPKYVRGAIAGLGKEIVLQLDNLPNINEGIVVSLSDPAVNMREFRDAVGYMNNVTMDGGLNYNAHYIMRKPIRGEGYKQGLHSSNLVFPSINGQRIRWSNALMTPSFKDMLMGVYPSIDECKQILDGDPRQSSVAFNRAFSLAKDHELGFYIINYKGRRVASGDLDSLILPSHNWYLNEILQSTGIRVR